MGKACCGDTPPAVVHKAQTEPAKKPCCSSGGCRDEGAATQEPSECGRYSTGETADHASVKRNRYSDVPGEDFCSTCCPGPPPASSKQGQETGCCLAAGHPAGVQSDDTRCVSAAEDGCQIDNECCAKEAMDQCKAPAPKTGCRGGPCAKLEPPPRDDYCTSTSTGCCGPKDGTESINGCCYPGTEICGGDETGIGKASENGGGMRRRAQASTSRKLGNALKPRMPLQKEPMCPCCVETMLKTNLNALEILISRVSEAHSRFKRCCIAFADLCCAKSRTDSGCCESRCNGKDQGSLVLEPDSLKDTKQEEDGNGDAADELGVPVLNGQSNEQRVILEVIGMDCPDCLSKVTRAAHVLAGAEVVNADAVRGLVDVKYDSNKIDLKAIQTFTSRASGFTINVLNDHPSERGKILVLPLSFETMPPPDVLQGYEVRRLRYPASRGWHRLLKGQGYGRAASSQRRGGDIELVIPLESINSSKPRDIMDRLSPYKPTLRSHVQDTNEDRIDRDLAHIAIRTFASLALTIPILVLVWSPTPLIHSTTSQSVQLGLASAIIIIAWPIYSGSFRSAYYLHRADLGVLTSFSTLTSYVFSVVAFGFELGGRNIGEPFFETVGLLITLIFAGRTLQASTRKLGLGAVRSLGRLQPEQARLLAGTREDAIMVDVRLLHYDDVLQVDSGEIIPTDGVVLKGEATADESSLTGESIPVAKTRGSGVTAGTTLTSGSIELAVTRLVPENAISAITNAVNSTSTGSDYQDLADRLAGSLLPVAGVCCLAALIGWMLVERYRRDQGWGEAVISGVGYAIAIAAVSCPCALAIAVNLVTSIAMATTVGDGVLFRSVQALLQVHSVTSMAFDKTGTLSQGIMAVQQTCFDTDPLSVRLLRAITAASTHPVSATVKRYLDDLPTAKDDIGACAKLEEVEIVPGQGVSASFYGFPLLAGNASFTRSDQHPLVQRYLLSGLTILVVTLGGQLIGLFGMKDQPRPGAHQLIADLEREGKTVSLVSGDNPSAVHAFATDLGIAPSATHAAQSPTSKAKVVDSLREQQQGRKGKVAFIGDGINDMIALASADFSIATGSASNASSQIIILASDIPRAMRTILTTSRMARNHVVASLGICGLYFAVAILLASGVTGWRIPPAYAGLGELVSIMPVLLVGAHLALHRWLQRRFAPASVCV